MPEKFDAFMNEEIAVIPTELTREYKNEIIDIKQNTQICSNQN